MAKKAVPIVPTPPPKMPAPTPKSISPMMPLVAIAFAVIGGLITSTFLSLLVIPVLFTYVDDARLWVLQGLRRKQKG
jgi:hypothetical protein